MTNPFVTKGYAGPEYFCDRVKETEDLVKLLTNDNNMALISPRRLGKTDLIYHVFNQPEIKKRYYTFVIDVYATNSLGDFVDVFGKAILEELKPFGRKAWERFVSAMKSIQQQISFDINGNPVWGLGLGNSSVPSTTLDEIFSYLRTADKSCLVAIDEFQQITQYADKNVEAALRTHIQRCPNATFLFSGSKRHMMSEIFLSPSRPFYQSVITMGLAPISEEVYTGFAVRQFQKGEKSLDEAVVHEVYTRFSGVTSCLQRVMNVLFLNAERNERCTIEMVDKAVNYLLDLYSEHYEMLFRQMSERQRLVFSAIAKEGRAQNITGGAFIKKYQLWSASSVMSAAKALLDKDFITQEGDAYFIYDQFFALWLLRRNE
jgi:AAA+ ATPase superfamily predicted ATPase